MGHERISYRLTDEQQKLVADYWPLVRKLVRRHVHEPRLYEQALDAVIDDVCGLARRYRPDGGAKFASMLYRYVPVAVRRSISRSPRRPQTNVSLRTCLSPSAPVGHAIEAADEVRHAMQRLLPRERAVVRLVYFEGKSQTESAAMLGVTPQRVWQVHNDALDRLATAFPA